MAELWKSQSDYIKALAGGWASFAALGSFLIYLFGYLSLRFHLTTFGIESELAVLDERYLFAGSRFMVYLAASVPSVVLLGLLMAAVVWLLFYLPYRVLPIKARGTIKGFITRNWDKICTWWSPPTRLALTGIVFSVVLIQFVMRRCFFLLDNLLVKDALPGPEWIQVLVKNEGLQALYFSGLVAGVGISGGFLFLAMSRKVQTTFSRLMIGLLTFLVAVQFLLLPVNHGILITEKTVPRVSSLGGPDPLEGERRIWLVWRGKESVTFLVQAQEGAGEKRTLLTLPRNKVERIEITEFDPILKVLFDP